MPDRGDVDDTLPVVDRVDHAILADSDSPRSGSTFEFLAAGRSRRTRERFDSREDPAYEVSVTQSTPPERAD